ncbi:hypothetical protein HPB47_003743 [Ixodes persulcatus]|uniref:Uncharacterized protein n=1 Tax=Ixodes persulcatus TaxID=34615 RepID=A0AC60PHL4_IXOPE|nr:hypothetical protein HPB47_003743 [Ixodes persulcatus]
MCLDTTLDLTFVKNVSDRNGLTLESDHFIVATAIKAGPSQPKGNKIRITKWDCFRIIRKTNNLGYEIENIESWNDEVRNCAEKATKTIPEEAELKDADSRLLQM